MKEQISWDPSLVKKFSSSNHFKLLNQLRSEVKKYPLNKKKSSISNLNNDTIIDNVSNPNKKNTQDFSYSKNPNINKDLNSNKSTVSFNNSKDFSIYNNISKDSTNIYQGSLNTDENKTIDEDISMTFKDRLDKIDMK